MRFFGFLPSIPTATRGDRLLIHSKDQFLGVFGPFLAIFGVYSVQLGSFPTETPREGPEGTKLCPTHGDTRLGAENPSFQTHLGHIWAIFGAFWAFFHFPDTWLVHFPLTPLAQIWPKYDPIGSEMRGFQPLT